MNYKGEKIPKRTPKLNSCSGLQCACNSVSNAQKQQLCAYYWGLGNSVARSVFLTSHITEKKVEQKCCKPPQRLVARTYHLPVNGELIKVCKHTFLDTLSISEKVVRVCMSKKEQKKPLDDQRGKCPSGNKISDDDAKFITDHILSFPRVESHYCRSSTNKQYLSPELNIAKMYELYKQRCKEECRKTFSHESYRKQFNSLNLSFHQPKKDQCALCHSFKLKQAANLQIC